MVAKELAYNIVVGAIQTSDVDLVFGRLNKDVKETQTNLKLAEERQRELNKQISAAKKAGEDYTLLQQQFEGTQKEVDGLTTTLSDQREELRRSEKQVNQWATRMQWATGVVTLATGALTAFVAVQGKQSEALLNVEMLTGQSVETMERLDQAARLTTGRGLAPETWLGITDYFRGLNEQIRLGGDLSEEQYIAFQNLNIDPFTAATLGAKEWYEALLRVPPELRTVTAQAAGISGIYDALRPAIEEQKSWNDVMGDTVAVSGDVHQGYADASDELERMTNELKVSGQEMGNNFTPHLTDLYAALIPVVNGFSTFVKDYPGVVRALAAIGLGLAVFTTAMWLANVAASFFATVTGVGLPLVVTAGIVAAAVATAGGVAFAGLGGFSRGKDAEDESEETRMADSGNTDRTVRAIDAQGLRQEAIYERSRQELDPILRQLGCLEERVGGLTNREAEGRETGVTPVTPAQLEPFNFHGFTPEEMERAAEGISDIERKVPTSNVGEQLGYYSGQRQVPFSVNRPDDKVMRETQEMLGEPKADAPHQPSIRDFSLFPAGSLAQLTPAENQMSEPPAAPVPTINAVMRMPTNVESPAVPPSPNVNVNVDAPAIPPPLAAPVASPVPAPLGIDKIAPEIDRQIVDFFRGLFGQAPVAGNSSQMTANIENHFYNNPAPAPVIIQETEREIRRMENRR